MKNIFISIALLFSVTNVIISQSCIDCNLENLTTNSSKNPCLAPKDFEDFKIEIKSKIEELSKSGKLNFRSTSRAIPQFEWPIRQAPGFEFKGYYATTNYVDLNPSMNDSIDYMGGIRTYNQHNGLDLLIVPYFWNKMYNNEVWAIAAAPGIVVDSDDGWQDQSCSWPANPPPWNFITIMHADSTTSTYGHLRTGTVAPLANGTYVNTGDYMGIVGSSGNSTAPHLHFMVIDKNGQLVEPYLGPSNNIPMSYWANQKPYYESRINDINTHSLPIQYNPCPQATNINDEIIFDPNDDISFSISLQDARVGYTVEVDARYPNSAFVILSSSFSISTYLSAATYQYDNIPIGGFVPQGKWEYTVILKNDLGIVIDSYTKNFWVLGNCPQSLQLGGFQFNDEYIFADDWIESTQSLIPNADVVYDADQRIILKPGFSAPPNTKFQTRLDFKCPN